MTDRPEYVACIKIDDANLTKRSWCGRALGFEFHFQDIDHAALNGKQNGRLVACPECTTNIVKALRNGQDALDLPDGA